MNEHPPPDKRKPRALAEIAASRKHFSETNFTAEATATQGAAILPFPRMHHECSGCGIQFRPLHPSHARCFTCWRWGAVARHVTAARRLFQGA